MNCKVNTSMMFIFMDTLVCLLDWVLNV